VTLKKKSLAIKFHPSLPSERQRINNKSRKKRENERKIFVLVSFLQEILTVFGAFKRNYITYISPLA
jgi:hypothetical protein